MLSREPKQPFPVWVHVDHPFQGDDISGRDRFSQFHKIAVQVCDMAVPSTLALLTRRIEIGSGCLDERRPCYASVDELVVNRPDSAPNVEQRRTFNAFGSQCRDQRPSRSYWAILAVMAQIRCRPLLVVEAPKLARARHPIHLRPGQGDCRGLDTTQHAPGRACTPENADRYVSAIRPELPRSARSSRCLLYTSPSPRDGLLSRMPSSA